MRLPVEPPIEPMLAKAAADLPAEEGWLFEPKWDGVRTIALVRQEGPQQQVLLQSRSLNPMNDQYPEVVDALYAAGLPDVVLDGEIVSLPGVAETLSSSPSPASSSPSLTYTQPRLRAMGMVAPNTGWTILSDRLLWSEDGGITWQDITPAPIRNSVAAKYRLLTASFFDRSKGMAVLERVEDGAIFGFLIKKGGQTGQMSPALIPISGTDTPVQTAYLDYVDERIAYAVVRLRSGSAFSLGRLFATEDGGRTWQERSLPGGEAVTFLDPQLGWTTGRSPDRKSTRLNSRHRT